MRRYAFTMERDQLGRLWAAREEDGTHSQDSEGVGGTQAGLFYICRAQKSSSLAVQPLF